MSRPVRPILPSDVGQFHGSGAQSRAATRRPTTTGKIERFHRTLRTEFLTGRVLDDLATAQDELDRWVVSFNT